MYFGLLKHRCIVSGVPVNSTAQNYETRPHLHLFWLTLTDTHIFNLQLKVKYLEHCISFHSNFLFRNRNTEAVGLYVIWFDVQSHIVIFTNTEQTAA
jgi:hypothetical protein